VLGSGTRTGEGAAQVHLDHGVEVVVGHVPQHPVAQDTRVGDHDVESAELLHRPCHQSLGRLGGPHRDGLGDRATAARGDGRGRRCGGLLVDVVDDDGSAGVGERLRVGEPEALSCAGDDGDLAGDVHACAP
jgi:hypothetical protein